MANPVLAFSVDLHARLFGWIKGAAFGTAPTNVYMCLLTEAPNPDDDGTALADIEPGNGNTLGYERQEVTFGDLSVTEGVTSMRNSAPVVFGPATGDDWPPVSHAALVTNTGEMLAYGPLGAQRVAVENDAISFGANAIQLRGK